MRSKLDASTGMVALTFDDGPDPRFTPLLLDVLDDLGVTATFFCVGHKVEQHPDLVRRIVASGHHVGSHSQTHHHSTTLAVWRLHAEFLAGRRSLERVLDEPCPLFRPPSGYIDVRVATVMRQQGLHPWLWTVDPEDWRPGADPEQIAAVAGRARAGDVVLLHDGIELPEAPEALDRGATVAAIPRMVEEIRAKGLDFSALPLRPVAPARRRGSAVAVPTALPVADRTSSPRVAP